MTFWHIMYCRWGWKATVVGVYIQGSGESDEKEEPLPRWVQASGRIRRPEVAGNITFTTPIHLLLHQVLERENPKSSRLSDQLRHPLEFFVIEVIWRETPSVAGIINPGSEGFQELFFGQEEIAIPVHSTYVLYVFLFIVEAACAAHPIADVLINFASYRSAATSSNLALKQPIGA
ncbi:hypothetical protein E3N88_14270 [Mikania micrantha]|uniref:Uncharacterized protein n=1 Tax=Mikania micrantha TaxID=192012 RepID=A0A5N6P0X7_9ASTR|nr:hypothetical protein E3N88_14270 [Mikania micrantha]